MVLCHDNCSMQVPSPTGPVPRSIDGNPVPRSQFLPYSPQFNNPVLHVLLVPLRPLLRFPHSTSPRPFKPHPSPTPSGPLPPVPCSSEFPATAHSTLRPPLPRQLIILPFSMSSWFTHPSQVPYSILPLSASHPSSGPTALPSKALPLSRYFRVLFPNRPTLLVSTHSTSSFDYRFFMLARLLPHHRVPS